MKEIINNHVHGSQIPTVDVNRYTVSPMILKGFGIMPKFEISPEYPIVVEYIPRNGLRGLIFSSLKHFCPASDIEVFKYEDNKKVKQQNNDLDQRMKSYLKTNLFNSDKEATKPLSVVWDYITKWRYNLGWIIKCCRIRTERNDLVPVDICVNKSEITYTYMYDACIRAEIDPRRFYDYIKNKENQEILINSIIYRIKDIIAPRILGDAGKVNLIMNTIDENIEVSTPETEKAGYHIINCHIEYLNK